MLRAVSFLLISHGYCIMYERMSLAERRKTAGLACIVYLTLVGYKAAVPYFTVLMLLNYFLSFYVIFRYISQNLFILREQLNSIDHGDMQTMHGALRTKYIMFKKFQGAMQIVAVVEILVYMNADARPESYWFRLLVREWAQFCIFLYIGWTFRTKEALPNFPVIPTMKLKWENTVPPIYSMEMDAADFNNLTSQEWHVGVPTSFPSPHCKNSVDPLLVIVQHPHATSRGTSEALIRQKLSISRTTTAIEKFPRNVDHV
ncbi:uncharacterized protein A4U43_C05F19580 [Asparagus officinalis]|uniref:Uncharacterized protein n=1 Tax=Asparagus officinalis TaxID=4686 RepID=A0A5P1ESZ9_ASPOF|nr:uncharacterized protein A4U43_C05F19580 [Asparagus officinalis]